MASIFNSTILSLAQLSPSLFLLLLYIPFLGVLFERGITGARLFSFVVESQLINIMKQRANPCLVDVIFLWNVSMLI